MKLADVKNSIWNILFPIRCLGCFSEGKYVCDRCRKTLGLIEKQQCPNCFRNVYRGEFCSDRCAKDFHFDQLLVGMMYDKAGLLKKMIVRYKYKFSKELSVLLSEILIKQLAHYFGSFEDVLKEMVVVPVPLHKKKLKERGFNQSEVLARAIGKYFSLEVVDALERAEQRTDQAKLGRKGRIHNLEGNFKLKVSPETFANKVVFLVDDVATTGSTLNECSRMLKTAGAKWICGLAIARAR